MTKLVITTTKRGTRLHNEGCRYAKTGTAVTLADLDATPASCCRPKPEAIEAARTALTPKRTRKQAANRTRHTTSLNGGQTVVIGVASRLEAAEVPEGVRWIRKNRLGSLVASVDLWQHSGDDGGPRWGAMCLTHGTTARHETHRDAWKTLPKSNEWCEGCREAVTR
ncbi:hypothetical protein [Streptomyces sp. enrichment culture]|uniref:hypothetical protein n=1 Tax=Streptomyces sp. enrichment culture TaxID=1795815 RepID=UPI003F56A09B